MLVLAFLFLASYAITSTDATQNATSDTLIYGWVSINCGRGTSEILRSCLFTIFLCVWTVLHRPVPRYQGPRAHSFRTKIVRSKIVPAIIVLIAPEFLIFTAVRDFQDAMQRKKELNNLGSCEFTLTHGFFFDMGGFCLKSSKPRIYHQLQVQDLEGLTATPQSDEWIPKLENISEDRIKDSATSDNIAKSLACLQGLWLATQVVSRSAHHQAVTLLEVSTMAYVICALIAYGFWWNRPQNCAIPVIVDCSDEAMDKMEPSKYGVWEGTMFEFICSGQHWIHQGELGIWQCTLLFVLAPSVFGAVHLASWDIPHPTDIELWLWRGSIVACLVIPILFALVVYLQATVILNHGLSVACMHILVLAYILVRIYMLVEDFLSLRALPSSVYDTVKWSSLVPHI